MTVSKNHSSKPFVSGEAWDRLLTSASHLQAIIPGAVLVGGSAAVAYANHRLSYDADHVVIDLKSRFEEVLADLEATQGWQTNRVRGPVLIIGKLDGVETGVRQLIRQQPLEYTERNISGHLVRLPTLAETLRIKGVLIIKRNTVRDFVDFAALPSSLGRGAMVGALASFDALYHNSANASPLLQLCRQLGNPQPSDLKQTDLHLYKDLAEPWREWTKVSEQCSSCAAAIATNGLQNAPGVPPPVVEPSSPKLT